MDQRTSGQSSNKPQQTGYNTSEMSLLDLDQELTAQALYERYIQLQMICSMTDAVSRAKALEDIYTEALNGLVSALKLDRVAILMYDSDSVMRFKAWRGLSDEYRQAVEGHSPWSPTNRNPQPVLISNINQTSELGALQKKILAEGIQALAFIPLTNQDRLLGKFMIYYNQPHEFSPHEIELTQIIASQIAFATDRKRTETELNTYRERLEALVQKRTIDLERSMTAATAAHDRIDAILRSIADGLIVTDLDHKVILANRAAEALLDFKLENIIGQEIGSGTKENKLREIVHQTINKQASGYETDIESEDPPNNRQQVLRARTALVDDQRGRPLGAVTIIQDVTRLREVDRLKTELLTTAAHELRTPLTSILGFSEILLTRDLDQSRQHHFSRLIYKQAAHLTKIMEDLLDISRLQAGKDLDLNLETVSLILLMQEIIIPFTEMTHQHDFQIKGLEKAPLVIGDSARLAQVGRNLLSNAIKYSPNGGSIIIRGQELPGYLQVSITDQGAGMTLEQQKYIFEPFYRADASNTSVAGAGLGLAVCKLIIQQHGGQIWLESQPGLGTTVFFTLPLGGIKE